jgi:hypothetical protein
MTEYHSIQQSTRMLPNGIRPWSLLKLDTQIVSMMHALSRSFSWHERNPRTVFEVSNGTRWWDPSYRRLADQQHLHGAQKPVPQARPRLPTTKVEGLQTVIGQDGPSRLEGPSRCRPTAGRPPPRGAAPLHSQSQGALSLHRCLQHLVANTSSNKATAAATWRSPRCRRHRLALPDMSSSSGGRREGEVREGSRASGGCDI